jgi:hypothetical protein
MPFLVLEAISKSAPRTEQQAVKPWFYPNS